MRKSAYSLIAVSASLALQGVLPSCSNDSSSGSGGKDDGGSLEAGSGGAQGTGGSTAVPDASPDSSTGTGGGDSGVAPCGNGQADPGEACDTAIAAGTAGACPTLASCDDNNPCTVDAVENEGTCTAACDHSTLVAANASTKDQCCPAGATAQTDADCSATCGNGVLDSNETCDTGISSGVGSCITSCADDGYACTVETLVTADPCNPICTTTNVTIAANGDSCCPPGANTTNDDDCTPSAFRMTSLTMLDPHPFFGDAGNCTPLIDVFNTLISNGLTQDTSGGADGGADGNIDLNLVIVLRPESHAGSANAEFYQAACLAPSPGSTCAPGGATPQYFTYTNQNTGTCLAPDPQYLNASYTPAPQPTTADPNPCAATAEATLNLSFSGLQLVFDHARVAAQWDADPASNLVQGLFIGFFTAARAAQLTLPSNLGGYTIGSLFPTASSPNADCPNVDDGELGPDGDPGWWWVLSFQAQKVTWTGP